MIKILMLSLLFQSSLSLDSNSALFTEVFSYHAETYDKADYAFQVVEKIYTSFRQWFFTIMFCEFTYFENRILKYIEAWNYSHPVLLLTSCPSSDRRKVKPRIDKQGKTTYVITSSEISLDLNDQVIQAMLRTGVFKPRSVVVFVINVPVEVDSYFYYSIKMHFKLLWSRKVTNSILIIYSDQLRVYAYNPFIDKVLDVTNEKDISNVLRKICYNLHGYPLRLSVFRKIYVSDDTGPLNCDSKIASTVINRFNATCVPLPPRDKSTVGDLLNNGTATGVTRDLLDGYTDLELNSRILKNSYYGYIDTTYPLSQDELCFLVKKAGRQTSFLTTIKLITKPMLTIFMVNVNIFILIGIVTRNLEAKLLGLRRRRASSTMMDLVKCLLKQTYDVKFLGTAFRTVIITVIIYSLIINCVIESIITSAITYPRYKPDIDTMEELIQSNLTFGVHNRHFKLFRNSMTEKQYNLAIENRLEIFNDKKITQVIAERQYQYAILLRKSDALAISRKPANMANGRPLYHTVSDCPIPCSIVYGLRYGSPYTPRLDDLLKHLNQAGILQHWAKTEEVTLFSNLGKIFNTDANKMKRQLNIDNLHEVFYVWFFGVVVSALVFAFEIISNSLLQRLWIV